jgi:hypothetical protein
MERCASGVERLAHIPLCIWTRFRLPDALVETAAEVGLSPKDIHRCNDPLPPGGGSRHEDRHSDGFLPPTRHQLA